MNAAHDVLGAERAAADAALARATDTLLLGVSDALADAVRYALAGGGKRLRPILCVTAFHALRRCEGATAHADRPVREPLQARRPASPHEHQLVHDLAAALEIIHTYSLVHDDLPCMDDDDLRRGRPTVHRAFGVRAAAVAGAFMIPLAFRQLDRAAAALGLSPDTRRSLVRELATAAGAAGMVGGQWLDLDGEDGMATVAALERIHSAKTGALMGAAFALGAIAADADGATTAAFRTAGRSLGVAFQIHDDVLDETASDAVLGKTAGKDRESGKATYPAHVGLDAARSSAAAAAQTARDALRSVGVADPTLDGLIAFAVERDR